jgi:hypothetical protein
MTRESPRVLRRPSVQSQRDVTPVEPHGHPNANLVVGRFRELITNPRLDKVADPPGQGGDELAPLVVRIPLLSVLWASELGHLSTGSPLELPLHPALARSAIA